MKPKLLDEKTLTRIPPAFVFLLVLILGLPVVALNYLEIDFSAFAKTLSLATGVGSLEIESQIRGYFRQTLLEWTAFSLSAVTVLLAFTQFRLAKDRIALVIGLSVLFSGAVQALHTLIIDGLSTQFIDQKNLDAVIWTFSNTISGLILVFGLMLILRFKDKEEFRVQTFVLLSILLLLIAVSLIYYAASRVHLPQMWFEDSVISRPYEMIYLLLYLGLIIFLYAPSYKAYPYILTNCIFYMAITQIVIAIYLMTLSSSPYDSGYNIAYFLKIIYYFIPFSCFIINYVYSYNAVLEAQGKLKLSQEKLKYIASHDALTDLYNRREFENLLNKAISNCKRADDSFALFIIDIDNFKTINDTLGHIQGDRFLKRFSEQLANLTRGGDVVSRIGGDEYTLITGKIKSASDIRKVAQRIVENLNITQPVNGDSFSCTVSVGIAIFPSDGETTEELFKHADIAMYNAKKSGKNTYRFYQDKFSQQQKREADIESSLKEALKHDEFTLTYQPIYSLTDRKIVSAEVLLRWYNNGLGDVKPEEFIHVAEQTGLMVHIGEWVLAHVCKQAKLWLDKYHNPLTFSINILPIQFQNNLFIDHLQKTLAKQGYPPNLLELEITEALLLDSIPNVAEGLERIHDLGIGITLDDFGMGYSSLRSLKSLPINTIKIDRLFIAEIQNKKKKAVVVDTIIKLAKELGMKVVAEGIETEMQLNYLLSKGCSYGQGFFLSKPLPANEFEQLVYLQDEN